MQEVTKVTEVIARIKGYGHCLTGTEIIRCRECAMWELGWKDGQRWCSRSLEPTPPEGFCFRAVREKAEGQGKEG